MPSAFQSILPVGKVVGILEKILSRRLGHRERRRPSLIRSNELHRSAEQFKNSWRKNQGWKLIHRWKLINSRPSCLFKPDYFVVGDPIRPLFRFQMQIISLWIVKLWCNFPYKPRLSPVLCSLCNVTSKIMQLFK